MNTETWDPENDDTADLPRDRGFEEAPAVQGLKTPPESEPGEESGEWTRGGGTDPNENVDEVTSRPRPA